MKARPLYLESTEIPAERTSMEIIAALQTAGARQITLEYAASGKITGLKFVLLVGGLPYPFKLPARVEAVQKIFKDRRIKTAAWNAYKFEARDAEQAERVAWRQLLAWVKAQLAMIATGMVQAHEVFSPYLLNQTGETLFEILVETKFKPLPPGKEA